MVVKKTLANPLDCREINQSILKEISPEYSLEGLMLKLKLQYFGHLMRRTNSLEKTLILGKIKGSQRRGRQRMRWLNGITDSMDMSLSKLWELVQGSLLCCSSWGHKECTGFSRQEYWSGSSFPSPRHLYNLMYKLNTKFTSPCAQSI